MKLSNILILDNSFIYLQIVKGFQVLLFNTNPSIKHYSFICSVKWFHVLLYNTNNSETQLKSFKYCHLTLILLNITHSFAPS